jgi:hypothetical protein
LVEITGEVDYIDKGEIAPPGIVRTNKKNIPVLRIRLKNSSGRLVQILYKGDYFGDATIGHEIIVKGIDKGGIIHASSIFNKTTDSWVTKSPGCLSCFIATAVYGSPFAKEVTFLRLFRDNYLLNVRNGERIIDIYYNYSPFIAKLIENNPFLKAIVNHLFLKPFIKVIKIYFATSNEKEKCKWIS